MTAPVPASAAIEWTDRKWELKDATVGEAIQAAVQSIVAGTLPHLPAIALDGAKMNASAVVQSGSGLGDFLVTLTVECIAEVSDEVRKELGA